MKSKRTPQEIIGNRRIRAIALDVDGTIADQHEKIPNGIVEPVRSLLDSGVHVIICTARSVENVLDLLSSYFSAEELISFDYIVLGGSHAYRVVRKDGNLVSSAIYAHSYDLACVYNERAVKDFLKDHTRVTEKTTSLLIDVGNVISAKRCVRMLSKKLKSRPIKAYQYHDKVCISLKKFDKNKGLREYLKHTDISNRLVVRIADQGAPLEADYEFLRDSLGFSVDTRDMSNATGCHWVYLPTGERTHSLSATSVVLHAIEENLKLK